MYSVVLVCIGKFQEYILTNLEFLIRLEHKSIVVLTQRDFFPLFDFENHPTFYLHVQLIPVEELEDKFQYLSNTRMDSSFRDGFWTNASMRFLYLDAYMNKYNIENIVHIENDVMLFYNVSLLEPYLNLAGNDKIYLPFDSYERNIASIVFIPTAELLGRVLEHYNTEWNDMQNFVSIYKRFPSWIDSFPISILGVETGNDEIDFVCKNYHKFGGFIFDAAAIGQYLGGVDPVNIPGDSIGFINETCVIKYNIFYFHWKLIDGVFCPFMGTTDPSVMNGKGKLEFPIFNLHIHCKDLKGFIL